MKSLAFAAVLLTAPVLAQGPAPPGDSCVDTIQISGEGVFAWDNTGMSTSAFDGNLTTGSTLCWGSNSTTILHDVFLTWTAPCGGSYSFFVTSPNVTNTKRNLHLLGDCSANCVSGIDDTFFSPFQFAANVAEGDELLIQIGSTIPGDTGAGTVEILNTAGPCAACGCTTPLCIPPNPHYLGGSVTLANSSYPSGVGSDLHIEATGGPAGEFGFVLVSAGGNLNLSIFQGVLCLEAPQGRYNPSIAANSGIPALNSIGQFDAAGVLQNLVGTSTTGSGFDVPAELPYTPPGQAINPGETWFFQVWYRDQDSLGAPSANFSDMIQVSFV